MSSPSDPKPNHQLVAEGRLLRGPYARTPEMRNPNDGTYWVFIQSTIGGEPSEMDVLRREFGWVVVTKGWCPLDMTFGAVYAHEVVMGAW